jgi:hypothetical protein
MINPKGRGRIFLIFPVITALAIWGLFALFRNNQTIQTPAPISAAYAYGENARGFHEAVLEAMTSLTQTHYLPYIYRSEQDLPATIVYTIPVEVMSAAIWGYDFEEAVTNKDFVGATDVFGVKLQPAEVETYYIISRSFLAWDVPEISGDYYLESVTLSFQSCEQLRNMPVGERLLFHQGEWAGYFTELDDMWDSYQEDAVGYFLIEGECNQWREIALDTSHIIPETTNRLLARFESDIIDMRHESANNDSRYSVLHLLSQPGDRPMVTIQLQLMP